MFKCRQSLGVTPFSRHISTRSNKSRYLRFTSCHITIQLIRQCTVYALHSGDTRQMCVANNAAPPLKDADWSQVQTPSEASERTASLVLPCCIQSLTVEALYWCGGAQERTLSSFSLANSSQGGIPYSATWLLTLNLSENKLHPP